jgi:hypothetical protein
VQRPGDRFTRGSKGASLVKPRESSARLSGNLDVGVVAMKKMIVVVVGLLGAILAGGASWGF